MVTEFKKRCADRANIKDMEAILKKVADRESQGIKTRYNGPISFNRIFF